MIMNFNKDQQKALDTALDQDVLISAGAGSGKTRVLTEKVYRVIHDDHVSPTSLLVLTFTNKAAFEMKDRIIKKFEKETGTDESSLVDEILSAHIQTFDSFSQYLVKKYARYLNIPDNINIIDETIFKVRKSEYLDEIFAEHYAAHDEKFISTLKRFNFREDKNTRNVILDLDTRLSSMTPKERKEYTENYGKFMTEEFLSQCTENYISTYKDEIRKSLKRAYIVSTHYEEYTGHKDQFIRYLARDKDIETSDEYLREDIDDALYISKAVYSDLRNMLQMNADDFIAEANAVNKRHKNYKFPDKNYEYEEDKEKDRAIYETFLKLFVIKTHGKFEALYGLEDSEKQLEKIRSFKDDVKVLFGICDELEKRLQDYKLLTNSYTFSDISLMALSLLTDEKYKEVSDEIKKSFTYIMVDEYQDTNDIQEEFLNALSQKATLFCVGDVKQSIYGFRNANCQLILDREKNYLEADDDKHVVIHMNNNYRSTEKMLEDINVIFGKYMSQNHGGVDYDESQCLNYDKESDLYSNLNKEGDYGVKVLDIVDDKELSLEESQAHAIAKEIRRKVDEKYEVTDGKKLRPCTYKDFAILVRRGTHFSTYERIFEKYSIPLNVKEKEGFDDIDVITVLQSLLALMSSVTGQKKANEKKLWMSVARSYLYSREEGYDDQKIYDILSVQGGYREDAIYKKVKNFAWKSKETETPISQIFLNLVDEFKVIKKLPTVGSIENGVANIESLYSLILGEEKLGDGVDDFVSLLGSVSKYKLSIEVQSETSFEDAVELNTIHGSKGLEYKIVYLPVSETSLSKSGGDPDKPDYTFSRNYGLILPDYRAEILEDGSFTLTPRYGILSSIYSKTEGSNDEKINEFVRLYYVAMTRAKECVYIVGKEGKSYYHETLHMMLESTGYYNKPDPELLTCFPQFEPEVNEINGINETLAEYVSLAKDITSPFALDMYRECLYDPMQARVKELFAQIEKTLNDIMPEDSPFAGKPVSSTVYPLFEPKPEPISLSDVSEKKKKKKKEKKPLPEFEINDTPIEAEVFEKKRASKINDGEEGPNQYILDFGTRMHRYMQLTDLRTKDTSYITNERERKIIDKALTAPFFDDLENAQTYSEYGYYDDEYKTAGYIDLLIVKEDEILIIDYKLKHIDDEAYTKQLHTYRRNVERLIGTSKPISCYLLALTTGEYTEIK